eukprot:gnl/MRDRNA2_/MRDRNA2_188002_c0_seq1.p1 gnl/MRDRNA2_/MRDRNA2_188002_c0~~gnl/MRDRNA2_/MRDRNA2_188002_c0_seq1.p1  ORF type:complete len:464 (+),score=57.84 gnl/MRDRNA2_/MRDRNA2_188002_c0_seq1:140-1393(+)
MASVQMVFGIWNPINDLVGAWFSDSWAARHGGSRVGFIAPQLVAWPIFCVLPFWPVMFHLLGAFWLCTLSLCIEDTFFSFVMIALGGLWTDITKGESERVKISRVEKIVGWVFIPMVSINYRMWSFAQISNELGWFAQYYAILAVAGMLVSLTALWLLTSTEMKGLRSNRSADLAGGEAQLNVFTFIRSLPRHKNFWCFIVMNVLNEVQNQFMSEFAVIFTDINLRGVVTVDSRSLYLSAEAFCVGAAILFCTFTAQQYGVYKVYLHSTLIKFLVGLAILPLSPNGYICAAYHLLANVCTGSALAFFVVLVGNLVDEYRYMQGDTRSTASVIGLFWGVHALFAKPADSLGPAIGTYVLEQAGWIGAAMEGPVTKEAKLAAWNLVIGLPVACGALQLTAWYFYDLHGAKLQQIQGTAS